MGSVHAESKKGSPEVPDTDGMALCNFSLGPTTHLSFSSRTPLVSGSVTRKEA